MMSLAMCNNKICLFSSCNNEIKITFAGMQAWLIKRMMIDANSLIPWFFADDENFRMNHRLKIINNVFEKHLLVSRHFSFN